MKRILWAVITLVAIMLVGILVIFKTEGWNRLSVGPRELATPTPYAMVSARPSLTPPPATAPASSEKADRPDALANLNLGAEPYAAQGDINAPLVIIEFSDFQ